MSSKTGDTTYVMDASAFVGRYRDVFAFDLAPTFWTQLEKRIHSGRIVSIDKVLEELKRGNKDKSGRLVDELAIWASDTVGSAFVSTDDSEVIATYEQLVQWVSGNQQFNQAAFAEFAETDNADGRLVAYAKVNGFTIVTAEKKNTTIKKRVPIPNICEKFSVRYVDLATMMRELNFKL